MSTANESAAHHPVRSDPSDDTTDGDVRVIYIAGIGRSGSTMLCRTLGLVDGFVATGELMRVLGRGLLNGDLCSCGAPVRTCNLWVGVRSHLERHHPELNYPALERTRKRVTEGWEFLRYLFVPAGRAALDRELDDYRRFLSILYRSVRAVTGARVIVDASKNLLFARLLSETPGIRMSILHLVRDSRGVAHSLGRRQVRPGLHGPPEYFRQQGPVLASILWTAANLMTERTAKRTHGYHRVRYEDFVRDPSATVRTIVELMDGAAVPLPHVSGRSVRLGMDHLIASNPNRSRRGDIELREDAAWRDDPNAARRWLVTGLTLPLLRRYGYSALPRVDPRPGMAGRAPVRRSEPGTS